MFEIKEALMDFAEGSRNLVNRFLNLLPIAIEIYEVSILNSAIRLAKWMLLTEEVLICQLRPSFMLTGLDQKVETAPTLLLHQTAF